MLCSLLYFGKCLLIRVRKVFPMLVWMLLLQGGLNQKVFRFLLRFVGLRGEKDRGAAYPVCCVGPLHTQVLRC